MPFYGVLASPSLSSSSLCYEFITPKPRNHKVILDADPDFDGKNDVIMKDADDDTESMDFVESCIPDKFKCCITLEVMIDPWIDEEGISYERTAILDWLAKKGKTKSVSPLTRNPLSKHQLQRNNGLRKEIQAFRRANPDLEWD